MSQKIFSKQDVLDYGMIRDTFAPYDIKIVDTVVLEQFRSFLGMDFLKDLENALVDYSNTAQYEWNVSYNTNNVVLWQGKYYIALVNTNNTPDCSDWAIAPRFNSTTCGQEYTNFFNSYLAVYLANCVVLYLQPRDEIQLQMTKVSHTSQQERLNSIINLNKRAILYYIDIMKNHSCYANFGKGLFNTDCSNFCNESVGTVKKGRAGTFFY